MEVSDHHLQIRTLKVSVALRPMGWRRMTPAHLFVLSPMLEMEQVTVGERLGVWQLPGHEAWPQKVGTETQRRSTNDRGLVWTATLLVLLKTLPHAEEMLALSPMGAQL